MIRFSLLLLYLLFTAVTYAQRMPEHWYRSQAALENGEFSLALNSIDSCLLKGDKNYQFWVRRGEIRYFQGEYQSSLESLLKADKLKRNSSSFQLAKCYCMLGDTASCFSWLQVHLGLSDKVKESVVKLEPAFDKISTTKHWKLLWNKEWYSPYEKLVSDAEYNITNENWEDVLDLLNPRLKGNRPRPQLLALRAEAYYGLGSFRSSVDDYSIAIRKSKKNHTYLGGRAKSLIALEKYSNAISDLTKAIDLSGGNPQYFKLRAEAYFKNKQSSLAFDDISYYASFYPSDSEASFLMAVVAIDAGQYVEALFKLGRLIKSNPAETKYYFYRGLAYNRSGNYSVAEIDLNFAIAKGYNLSESYFQRGIARVNLGKIDDACSDFDSAVKNGNFSAQEYLYKYCKKNQTQKW